MSINGWCQTPEHEVSVYLRKVEVTMNAEMRADFLNSFIVTYHHAQNVRYYKIYSETWSVKTLCFGNTFISDEQKVFQQFHNRLFDLVIFIGRL